METLGISEKKRGYPRGPAAPWRARAARSAVFTGIFALVMGFSLPASAAYDNWQLLGETVASGNVTDITVASFSSSRDLRIEYYVTGASAGYEVRFQFNSDTGNNYDWSVSNNGGAGSGAVAGATIRTCNHANNSSYVARGSSAISNASGYGKGLTGTCFETNPGNTPVLMEHGGYWNNTSAAITTIKMFYDGSVTYGAGSYLRVYGLVSQTPGASFPADANGYLKNNGSGTLTWDNAATIKTFLSLNNVENTALSTWAGTTNVTTLGTVVTGTWSGTAIAVNKGGTGQTSYTDGQLLIGNTTGNTLALATLTAGSNVTVTNGSGTVTIASSGGGGGSLPADAPGWLENDGAGTLSWSTPTAMTTTTTCTTGSGTTWTPCQPFSGLDVVFVIGWLGCIALFLFVGFWKTTKL